MKNPFPAPDARRPGESRSLEQRASLAVQIYDAVLDRSESFEEEHLGAALAYLLGAVLKDAWIDVFVDAEGEATARTAALVRILRETFPEKNEPVWAFLRFQPEDHPYGGIFVAHGDGTYLHGRCLPPEIDPSDDGVEVWENGSDGWTGPLPPCAVCGQPIDHVVGHDPEPQ